MSTEFYFIYPWWLLAISFVIFWFLITRKKPLQTPKVIQSMTVYYPLLVALSNSPQKQKIQNNRLLLCIIFSLLCISFAQPAFKIPIKNIQTEKQDVDLILVVNTSVSMVLRDYKEADERGELQQFDRMTKTKRVLKQLVSQFKGQRIALVVLGRPAAMLLPLTSDINQILTAIGKTQTTLGGRSSDIGATLQFVSKQFNQTSTSQKMVLLVSDGYVQTSSLSPLKSTEQLVSNHFILHTLAIGSPKQPEFSLGVGHLIYSPVNLKLMKSLAKVGKGSMIHAWQNKSVEEILNALDQPIKKESNSPTQFNSRALYAYPLSLAMLMMIIMLLPSTFFTQIKHV